MSDSRLRPGGEALWSRLFRYVFRKLGKSLRILMLVGAALDPSAPPPPPPEPPRIEATARSSEQSDEDP